MIIKYIKERYILIPESETDKCFIWVMSKYGIRYIKRIEGMITTYEILGGN